MTSRPNDAARGPELAAGGTEDGPRPGVGGAARPPGSAPAPRASAEPGGARAKLAARTRARVASLAARRPRPRSAQRRARAFLHHAEVRAERLIAWLRLGAALTLVALILANAEGFVAGGYGLATIWPSLAAASGLALLSALALGLIAAGRYRPAMGAAFAAGDVALAIGAVAGGASQLGLDGNHLFLLPAAPVAGFIVALNGMRYRPSVVLGVTLGTIGGAVALAILFGASAVAPPAPADAARAADLGPNLVRLAAVALTGLAMTLAVRRGQILLERVLAESRERHALTRFLPSRVVAALGRPGSPLREGVSIECVVMFVDMRGSTALTEAMEPHQVADFLSRFRRRISRAVDAHGGLIEKFTGDGAFVVFGAPAPDPSDADRALDCAEAIVEAIEAWNLDRDAGSRLAVVVALHAGPCFCGVVGGEEARLEFAVVGDTVNVGARLEGVAKERNETLLASAPVLERASPARRRAWASLGVRPIRGRDAPLELFGWRG